MCLMYDLLTIFANTYFFKATVGEYIIKKSYLIIELFNVFKYKLYQINSRYIYIYRGHVKNLFNKAAIIA